MSRPAYGGESDENAVLRGERHCQSALDASGGKTVDASTIDAELLRSLQEIDGVEANVATGYHAIEFLLWGQDLHGTGPGAGERPSTDYAHGDRAAPAATATAARAYLTVATDLLVADLEEMVGALDARTAPRARRVIGRRADGMAWRHR